jgi:hypothetical protein
VTFWSNQHFGARSQSAGWMRVRRPCSNEADNAVTGKDTKGKGSRSQSARQTLAERAKDKSKNNRNKEKQSRRDGDGAHIKHYFGGGPKVIAPFQSYKNATELALGAGGITLRVTDSYRRWQYAFYSASLYK